MPTFSSRFVCTVRENEGADLIDFLCLRFPYRDRQAWLQENENGRLLVENQRVPSEHLLKPGTQVTHIVVDYEEPEVPTDFLIVRRSRELLLVSKPAGLPVHRTGRIFFQTLVNLVRARMGDEQWSPLHRLDRETSGLLAFAKGHSLGRYSGSGGGRWKKLYLAKIPQELPRDEGLLLHRLAVREDSAVRCRMWNLPDGKLCLSWFKCFSSTGTGAWVLLSPITGRKHQLRAQLAAEGQPIIGDKIYSEDGRFFLKRLNGDLDKSDWDVLGSRNHMLHCCGLSVGEGHDRIEAFDTRREDFRAAPWEEIQSWVSSTSGSTRVEEISTLDTSHLTHLPSGVNPWPFTNPAS